MKIIIGLVLVITASIEARGAPKIQIYEIRDRGNNGIELKDLSSLPHTQRKVESQLLRLLSPKKRNRKEESMTQQLIDKLGALRGEEGNRISDDAFVYILQDIFSANNQNNPSSEEVFDDKTRNDRSQQNIRNILATLFRQSQRKPKHKKRGLSVLRNEDKIMAAPNVELDYEIVLTSKPESSE